MPEQRLHDAEVGAAGEEMRRKRVAQRVRRDAAAEAGGERATAHELPHRLARERPPAGAEEDERARAPAQQARPLLLDVRRERRTRVASERYHALFPALAEDGHEARGQVHLCPAERDRLRDTEAAGVEQLEQRPVAEPAAVGLGRPGEERADLARAERAREARGRAADAHAAEDVVRQHAA